MRAQAAAGGLYVLDDPALAQIAPDVVLTQDLCRVCAVPTSDVDTALARVGCPARLVTLEPQTLADVLDSILTVAEAAGVAERGLALRASLRHRLDVVAQAVAGRPRVPTLVLEWLDPPFTPGHWVPDVVTAAGGLALLGAPGSTVRGDGLGHGARDPAPRLWCSPRAGPTRAKSGPRPTSFRLICCRHVRSRPTSPVPVRGWSTRSRRWPPYCIRTPACPRVRTCSCPRPW